MTASTQAIHLEVANDIAAIFDAAAKAAGVDRNTFIVLAATQVAKEAVLNRTTFTLSADDFDALEKELNAPAKPNPALEKLMRKTPAWGAKEKGERDE